MPDPTPKPTFPVEAPPADFANLPYDKRIEWLNGHGLESDPTINLGDCYRCGTKLTGIFSLVYKVLRRLIDTVKNKGSAALKKYLNAFITAFKNGVGHLSNYIYTNVKALSETGKFNDATTAPTPVAIPGLPVISDDEPVTPATGKTFDMSFWGIFLGTLTILVDTWPWLNKIQTGMSTSYAQLLEVVANTGQTFFAEYQKSQSDDQP
ncbi:hypothetical protein AOL_s00210g305 [Orbilia oligospora ATCC 24927]|uniref:Uncharacterized protein n=1 Tax=Arthrobotrys oligospora (strain ATCC 24927 / CBS 115.81 / DSM 1491) TaxID=756982 RepID=G1XSE6_ARTOA|nr:hypothetical protein AOL_s00210g305 [Orbilia oligospora ATCC 24927]EGX43858.1 hypothetical protein AOL_s00210g305 [Orbilia oligospora ATCC 24927]